MIKKKICMLGAFAVGKTSLVQRFVHSIFSDKYHTTVGVNIEKAKIHTENTDVDLIIWDLYGEDEFQKVRSSYLRGASGCIYVVDGTRKSTLTTAFNLQKMAELTIGKKPFIFAVNKSDLKDQWEISSSDLEDIKQQGAIIIKTSAKTGEEVEKAFEALTRKMLNK